MTQPSSEYPTELEAKTKFYLELIRRIDAILADPVKTLIRITDEYITRTEQPNSEPTGFPVWMSDYIQPEPGDDLFQKPFALPLFKRSENCGGALHGSRTRIQHGYDDS